MSRDLAPRELLAYERAVMKSGGPSILDAMRNVTVSYNGSEFPYRTASETEHRAQFPLLGKLLNRFEPLYTSLAAISGGLDLLAQKEKELDLYVKAGQGDRDSPVILWFEGKLDEGFYYSETNEDLLLSAIETEAAAQAKAAHLFPQSKDALGVIKHPSLDGIISQATERRHEPSPAKAPTPEEPQH